jgi:hypothetical protein
VLNWIKEHPYLAGGMVLAVFVLFVLFRNRSAAATSQQSSAAGPSDSVAVAGLQANAAVQNSAYAAQTQIAGYSAQVNAEALKTAAETSIANTQTAGAVSLGMDQDLSKVAIASIAAGGIAPFSVAGTPGYNAGYTVGHAQVQQMAAGQAVAENTQIQQVSAAVAAPTTAQQVAQQSAAPYAPSTPTSIGSGITPGLPSPGGYATYNDYLVAVDQSQGINPATAGLSSSLGIAPQIETAASEAVAAWQSFYNAPAPTAPAAGY